MSQALYIGINVSTRENLSKFLGMKGFSLCSIIDVKMVDKVLEKYPAQLVFMDYTSKTEEAVDSAMEVIEKFPDSRFIIFVKSLPKSLMVRIRQKSSGKILAIDQSFSVSELMGAIDEVEFHDPSSDTKFDKDEKKISYEEINQFSEIPNRNFKIVIIDDSKTARKLFEVKFKKSEILSKCKPILASNCKDALEIIYAQKDIQLVITDYMMENCSGIDLIDTVRKTTKELPIFMVTSLSGHDHKKQAEKAGANEYITKPMDISIMESKVIKHLLPIWNKQKEKENQKT